MPKSNPQPGSPTTYAPPAPPTAANAAAVQAAADAKQKALQKQGLTATVLGGQAAAAGGDAQGFNLLKQQAPAGKATLLGGG